MWVVPPFAGCAALNLEQSMSLRGEHVSLLWCLIWYIFKLQTSNLTYPPIWSSTKLVGIFFNGFFFGYNSALINAYSWILCHFAALERFWKCLQIVSKQKGLDSSGLGSRLNLTNYRWRYHQKYQVMLATSALYLTFICWSIIIFSFRDHIFIIIVLVNRSRQVNEMACIFAETIVIFVLCQIYLLLIWAIEENVNLWQFMTEFH